MATLIWGGFGAPPLGQRHWNRAHAHLRSPHRLKNLCDNKKNFVGRIFSDHRHLPHLRRLESSYVVYPVLPHWATVFRASGAALLLKNQKLPTTSCQLQAASCRAKIPNRSQQSRSAGGATECSPARKGWEQWQRNSEHHRCDTYRSRIVVLIQTLKPVLLAGPNLCRVCFAVRTRSIHQVFARSFAQRNILYAK